MLYYSMLSHPKITCETYSRTDNFQYLYQVSYAACALAKKNINKRVKLMGKVYGTVDDCIFLL